MNRKAVVTEFGKKLVITEEEIPVPPPGGLVIKVIINKMQSLFILK